MSSTHPTPADHDLRSVMTFADEEAGRLLANEGPVPLDAVAWLSVHVAAVGQAVYPVVRRSVPHGDELVARQRTVAARLIKTLRVVERHHSGDVLSSGLDTDQMLDVLRTHLSDHQRVQSELIGQLVANLTDTEQASVVDAYERALEHAPTRPHPHLSRGGLMFRLDAIRDKLLDTMDGRTVTVPRVERHTITPGRWGSYLLGHQHEGVADAESEVDPDRD